MSIPAAAFIHEPTHLLDTRRPVGKYALSNPRADGTGYTPQVVQYPVICALDIYELPTSNSVKAERVVTSDPRAVRCKNCRTIISGGIAL